MDSSVTGQSSAAEMVTGLFAERGAVGLKLPSGWFGRPYDTLFQLSGITEQGDDLVIELGPQHRLTLTGPVAAENTSAGVRLVGFRMLVWEWEEYGSEKRHCDKFEDGVLEFVTLPG